MKIPRRIITLTRKCSWGLSFLKEQHKGGDKSCSVYMRGTMRRLDTRLYRENKSLERAHEETYCRLQEETSLLRSTKDNALLILYRQKNSASRGPSISLLAEAPFPLYSLS